MSSEEISIYIPTVFYFDFSGGVFESSRSWGFFMNFEEVEDIILNNITDVFECGSYEYAVIEKVEPGMFSRSEELGWYFATYKDVKTFPLEQRTSVTKIEKPERFKGTKRFCGI